MKLKAKQYVDIEVDKSDFLDSFEKVIKLNLPPVLRQYKNFFVKNNKIWVTTKEDSNVLFNELYSNVEFYKEEREVIDFYLKFKKMKKRLKFW